MSKKSLVERDRKRRRMALRYAGRRARLKAMANDKSLSAEEQFAARLKLARLPRNSAPSRARNRCELTGRGRGYYRKLGMSRIMLRSMALRGEVPGMVKSSW